LINKAREDKGTVLLSYFQTYRLCWWCSCY